MGSKRKRAPKEASIAIQPSGKRSKKNAESNNVAAPRPEAPGLIEKRPFVETPTGDERKREAYLYDFLGSEDGAERIGAADAIVSCLIGEECVPEPVLLRHLEHRLFRGLASSRKGSRLGFSLVLTELLGQLFGDKNLAASKFPGLTFDKALGILLEKTHTGGSVPGLEERDHYYGQLFGIECFVRSGTLFEDKARWKQVLDLLLKMAQKKVWLRSQCGWIIVQAIPHMKKKTAQTTLQKLVEEGLAQTPEGVGIWMTALDRFPKIEVPSKPWKDPLSPSSLASLPAVLKDSGRDPSNAEEADIRKQKQSTWTAQLHFVWDLILAHFVKLEAQGKSEAAAQFKQFWTRVVDESFFSKNASETQKFSGFMVFQKMLEGGADSPFIVESLFSKNFMACLMNQASKEDRYLHRAASKALKGIEAAVEGSPDLLEPVLQHLLGKQGAYNFDQRTNTKTVERLLQNTTPSNVTSVMAMLNLKDPSRSGLEYPKYLQVLSTYLFKLANLPSESSLQSELPVPASALRVLAGLAYSNSDVPERTKEAIRTKLTAAFTKFVKRPEDFLHLCEVILSIQPNMTLKGEDEAAELAYTAAVERLRKLLDHNDETSAPEAPRQALALLHAVGILQYYNEDPDAVELFDELEQCYDKLESNSLQDGEGISEYLVEILLAMVARPSSLMRNVSQQVFEAFSHLMSAEAISLLTEPLAADENAKGQQALFSTEEEDMVDDEDEDSEVEMDEDALDSDVELVDLEDVGSQPSGAESEESEGEEDSDNEANGDDADGPNEELQALDAALEQILNSRRPARDRENQTSDSDSDSDMTDSEMMQLDEKLVEVFRHRAKTTGRKKANREAKGTVVNFKHRVLDLLAIFARKESAASNPLAFAVLLPLLRLVRTTTDKALAKKAHDTLLGFNRGLKKARSATATTAEVVTAKVDGDALMELLADIHAEAGKDQSHSYARAASSASLAVASVLCAAAGYGAGNEAGNEADKADRTEQVFALYARTQLSWYRREVKMQMAFFGEWLNWCQSHAAAM